MAKTVHTEWNREDRDLLIELRTEMSAVREDIKSLNSGVSARLLNLESNSVSKIEIKSQFDDHENRLRFIERYMWLAIGALGIIEFGLQIWSNFK